MMMLNRQFRKNTYMTLVTTLMLTASATALPVRAQTDGDDRTNINVQPADVSQLEGKEMSYDKRSGYVTIGRPQDNADKMFLLYNVGQKKFLNVGSYWGTHAALSTVPRPFWFQRRNEVEVSPMWGYLRYPETPGESIGYFAKDFFALKTLQIGSLERSKQAADKTVDKTVAPHVTYNYIRYYASADDQTPKDIVNPGFTATGNDWMQTLSGVSFATGGRIEAQIDLTACQGNGSSTDGKTHMETVLSIGSDIKYWDLDGFMQNNLHIYAFRKDGQSYIRVMAVDADYKDATHKSGSYENPITVGSDNIINVIIENGSIRVKTNADKENDVQCMPRNRDNLTSPIAPLFSLSSLSVGSKEGTKRTSALVNYIKFTSSNEQATEDSCVVKPGTHYTSDQKFYREYSGNLKQWQVRAVIDLTTCTGKNENILSIGTAINEWTAENDYNVHFYYTAGNDYIQINSTTGKSGSSTSPYQHNDAAKVSVADPHRVVVFLNQDGLHVDGTLVQGTKSFDPDNDPVIGYLLDSATKLQVGSLQGDSRSHATYRSVTVDKSKRTFPDATAAWDKSLFMRTITGNLSGWEINAEMDLTTCTSGSKNENVLSIGTNIAEWGKDSGDNIHIFYTPDTKTLEFDAINSSYPGNQWQVKKVLTDPSSVKLTLKKNGLYLNGELVQNSDGTRQYNVNNPIISNLAASSTAHIQIGTSASEVNKGNGSDALYNKLEWKTVSYTDPTDPTQCLGEAWNGTAWELSHDGNLTDWQVVVKLKLSSCTQANENVLSIGDSNISDWNDGSTDTHNIHLYWESAGKLQFDAVDLTTKGYNPQYCKVTKSVSNTNELTITLCKYGLYLGSEKIYDTENPVVKYLTESATKLFVGSRQGTTRSHATYTAIGFSAAPTSEPDPSPTVTFPVAGQQWDGNTKFSKEISGNLANNPIEAVLDVSACTASDNILSIGTYIANWGTEGGTPSTANNIHFYYPKNGKLGIDVVYKDGNKYKQFTTDKPSDNKLTIKLTADGLWVNGSQVGSDDAVMTHVIGYLSSTATSFSIGSEEGSTRSHATYTSLTVGGTSILEAASASAKTALFAVDGDDTESGTTGSETTEGETTTTTSPVTDTLMPKAEEYVPVYNLQGDGRTAFGTESYNVDLTANGNCVEAQVDLSKATTVNENVLSIGSNIATWMKAQDGTCYTNLHIYYAGQNADGEYTLSIAYTDKDNNDGLRRAFAVEPAADGSALATIRLANGKLTINGHEPYTLTDILPAILYDDAARGDIVRFKTEADGSFAHDANGRLIEVKQGEEGFETAKPIKVSLAKSYLYTDDLQEGVLPLFISSRFKQETSSNGNEGQYFSWSPYLPNNNKWGTVGVFADRALPQKEITNTQSLNCSEWFIEPYTGTVAGEDGKKLYRIYLKMSDVEKPVRNGVGSGNYDYKTQTGQQRYYLQATNEYVYGDNLEEYYNETDASKRDYTNVEALNNGGTDGSALGTDLNSVWKIIDLNEYHRLFETEKSEMTTLLDLSYMLSDPSFSRENYELTGWKIDDTLKGHLRMGYDYFSKKWTDEQDYTDENSRKTEKDNGAILEHASTQHEDISAHTNNHARYMGLDVRGENAGGNIRQDVTVSNPGWYAFSCYGFSNIGASLFVQVVSGTGDNATVSAPVEQQLPTLTAEKLKFFNDPTSVDSKVGWPYHTGSSYHMPMYNALVSLNDHNVKDGTVPDQYYTQVAFFVDPDVLETNGGSMTLRFGLKVPSTSGSADAGTQTLADDTDASLNEDYTIGDDEHWTVVDDFRLLFGGLAQEPNLILDEDNTTLDYLDNTIHEFNLRPLRLHRTFTGDRWNTIILPVNLSKSQFEATFGSTAKLAQLDHLTATTVEFVSAKEENSVLLQAYKPYIIWVDKDHAAGKGKDNDGQEYEAKLSQRANSAKLVPVTVPGNHFYIENVTLQGAHEDSETKQSYYSFKEDTKQQKDIRFEAATAHTTGELYTYRDNTVAKLTDADADNKLPFSTLRAYGTLCKNFTTTINTDGTKKNTHLSTVDNYPTLAGGYVMENKTNTGSTTMSPIKSIFGTKGFRCWFAPETQTEKLSANMKVVIDGVVDTTTKIEDIYADTLQPILGRFADGVYGLDGRMVRQGTSLKGLPAGVYIVGGKKVAVTE